MTLLRQGMFKYAQTRILGLVKHALKKQAPLVQGFGTPIINVENTNAFLAQAERIHVPSSYAIDYGLIDATLGEEAKALHARLVALSIV